MTEQTKKCSSCGSQIDFQASFCGSCGAKYEEAVSTANVPEYIEQEQIAPIPPSNTPIASNAPGPRIMGNMGFKELYFSSEGRIGKNTYFLKGIVPSFVYLGVFICLVMAIAGISGGGNGGQPSSSAQYAVSCIAIILSIPLIWAMLMMQIKRLHDLNHSGWMMLAWYIPFVGAVLATWNVFEMIFKDGGGPNKYGDYTF